MATVVYNAGLDLLGGGDWTTGTFRFLLLNDAGYVPNPDDDFVSTLVPGTNEISVAGYSRQTAAGKTRTVSDSLDRITYDCTDPNFGTLTAGENVAAMVLFKFVTVDADSPLIVYYPIGPVATAGVPFPVSLPTNGVAYTQQG